MHASFCNLFKIFKKDAPNSVLKFVLVYKHISEYNVSLKINFFIICC